LPQYDLPYVIAPLPLALVSMALWLLIKGIDRPQWDAKQVVPAIWKMTDA
jgi:hypothetical protein